MFPGPGMRVWGGGGGCNAHTFHLLGRKCGASAQRCGARTPPGVIKLGIKKKWGKGADRSYLVCMVKGIILNL